MITIRTGGNGSYKSAYTAWFVILPALKAGRVVVTNFEGMQPLHVIEERLNIKFPSSAKLIRIFSRSQVGVELWQHFFCWCPLNALVVIDECQDIFSKRIGFDDKKVKYRPLSDFLEHLPDWYEDFFNSRHVPVDMTKLEESEIDDLGRAEYDESGRIIYPMTYNEGFMRHRKYNWDIELLSPSWKQIDDAIKECAEQAFYHKNRDKLFLYKRKPYIYQHPKNVSTPVIPNKKDPGLFTEKIPLEAHLLYKSTGTGDVTKSGGLNVLFRSPKMILTLLLMIICPVYVVYGLVDLLTENESEVSATEPQAGVDSQTVQPVQAVSTNQASEGGAVLSGGGDLNPNSQQVRSGFVPVTDVLYFEGLERAYLSGFHRTIYTSQRNGMPIRSNRFDVVINAYTKDGLYSINDRYLKAVDVTFEMIDECLMVLKQGELKSLITCEPNNQYEQSQDDTDFAGIGRKRADAMSENSFIM
ncbi:zonular occludens toxin domain-containing protein [Vibrio rotiferianus]|uniref:zonular occludens toxin domain-containing protein n=1 Tax=Vibrio rotiferianus TaxID=190895 RepID=UPI00390B7303